MRKLAAIAVVAFLVWFLFLRGGDSSFGCDPAGAAHAAEGGECPTSFSEAASSRAWADDRIESLARKHVTTGLLYNEDGDGEQIDAGESGGGYDAALGYLAPYHLRDSPPGHQAAGHVESKAAARMRDAGQTFGVLVINNRTGPCTYASAIGCGAAMRKILPSGSTLVVWWPGGKATMKGTA